MNLYKQNLINKIKYRSKYRGTKEMDLFVDSFVNKIIYDLNLDELDQLNKIINLSDEELVKISNIKKKLDKNERIISLLIDFKKKY